MRPRFWGDLRPVPQLQQLDIRRNPPRLIFGEQVGGRAPRHTSPPTLETKLGKQPVTIKPLLALNALCCLEVGLGPNSTQGAGA
jgi:hypothetical protein